MDQEENHAYDHKTVGKVEDGREKGHLDVIHHISQQKPVDEVADAAADNQDGSSPGKKGVLLIKNHGRQHHYNTDSGNDGQNQGEIIEHSKGRPGVFHINKLKKIRNGGYDPIGLQILHHQIFQDLIPGYAQDNQDQ